MDMNKCRKTALQTFCGGLENQIKTDGTTIQQFATKIRTKNKCRKTTAEVPQNSYSAALEKCRKILPQNPPPYKGGGVFCGSNVFGDFFQPAKKNKKNPSRKNNLPHTFKK